MYIYILLLIFSLDALQNQGGDDVTSPHFPDTCFACEMLFLNAYLVSLVSQVKVKTLHLGIATVCLGTYLPTYLPTHNNSVPLRLRVCHRPFYICLLHTYNFLSDQKSPIAIAHIAHSISGLRC